MSLPMQEHHIRMTFTINYITLTTMCEQKQTKVLGYTKHIFNQEAHKANMKSN